MWSHIHNAKDFDKAVEKIKTALNGIGYIGEVVGDVANRQIETDFAIIRMSSNIMAYNKKTGKIIAEFSSDFYWFFSSDSPRSSLSNNVIQNTLQFLAGNIDSPLSGIKNI